MKVFLKYITKSMAEKKGRFLLLLFSVTISTALLLVSLGLVDIIISSFRSSTEEIYEGKDIYIHSNTENMFFSLDDFESVGLGNIEGEISFVAIINEDNTISHVNVRGRESYEGVLIEGEFMNEAVPSCVISDRIAKERNLKIGSKINILINGEKNEFFISGIGANERVFCGDQSNQFTLIVPYIFLEKYFDIDGLYNYMTAEVSGENKESAIEYFNEVNDSVLAVNLYDEMAIVTQNSTLSMVLYIMLAIVCVMSYIIINGSFKLIIFERLPVIGIFMSQGASHKKVQKILFFESGLYGLLGGILGIIIGECTLAVINYFSSPFFEYGIYNSYNIKVTYIIEGIVFAVVLSTLSAMSPIFAVRKQQVKDIILNKIENKREKKIVTVCVGFVLFVIGMIGFISEAEWAAAVSIPATLSIFIGAIMITPIIIEVVMGSVSELFRKRATIYIALNNIKTSKLLSSNILLLVIVSVAVLLVVSSAKSMVSAVVEGFQNLTYDYNIGNIIDNNIGKTTTDSIIEELSNSDIVNRDSINPMNIMTCRVDSMSTTLYGVEPKQYAVFNEYLELQSERNKELYSRFENAKEQSIIITEVLSQKINKTDGDMVEVEIDGKKDLFKIIGIIDGKLLNGSSFVMINRKYMKSVYQINEASNISFSIIGKVEEAENKIKDVVQDFGATFVTKDENVKRNLEANSTVVTLLSAFAYIVMIIATIGIINNISISFQQRKREFAIMASVGMNRNMRSRLILSESLICVICSIIIAFPLTIILVNMISKILRYTGLPMSIVLNYDFVVSYLSLQLIIIFIASLPSMKKGKSLDVVTELKYE